MARKLNQAPWPTPTLIKPKKNVPEGFWEIKAFTNGYQIVILGSPPDAEDLNISDDNPLNHNCDQMGCGSVGSHVLARIPIMYPMPELRWTEHSQAPRKERPTPICPDCKATMVKTEIVDRDGEPWVCWVCQCDSLAIWP